jgi:hypothetical protein
MTRGPGDGALDLRAVRRDDELLDSLGRRGPGDAGDPASLLLAALAVEVDHGIAEVLSTPLPDAAPPVVAEAPSPAAEETGATHDVADDVQVVDLVDRDPEPRDTPNLRRRRRTAYGAAAALALGATFSVSGVAAAVTGDPFAAYRAVGGALSWGDDDLPPNAAQIAHLNKRLARARAAIAHGDVAGVQERIDALRAGLDDLDLSDGQRAALERKLDRLEAAAARAAADGKNVPPGQGANAPGEKGDKATGRGSPTTGGPSTGGDAGGGKSTGGSSGADESGGDAGGEKSTGGKAGAEKSGGKAGEPKDGTAEDPAPGKKASTGSTSGAQTQTGTGEVTGDEAGTGAGDKGGQADGKKG